MSFLLRLLGAALASLPTGPKALGSSSAVMKEPATHAYAIIVATNAISDRSAADLRYADDDGARYHELFSLMARRAEILSVLDPETQRTYPKVTKASRAPTRSELLETVASVFTDIERDKALGFRTVFYFVYVGHGSVGDDGEGAMHLSDGRFTRSDLFQHVVSRSRAHTNHVIIDACNAYLMVARRGADAPSEVSIDDAVEGFVGRESLGSHPNTGILVSTSQAADVHEWARFEAGIFSHEVRSAMAGAADIDGDRSVTYDEVRAFIGAANARVIDPKARLTAFAAPPPINHAEPLFDLGKIRSAPRLHVPTSLGGRRFLEDERGVRYADFHIASDGPITLVLVPSPLYFLRSDTDEIAVPSEAVAEIDAGSLPRRPIEIASRGSEAITFQRDLFAVPFGRAYFEGFRDVLPFERRETIRAAVHPEVGFPTRRWISVGLAGAAVVVAATGLERALKANARAKEYGVAIGDQDDVDALRSESRSFARAANALYGIAGGLMVGAATLWLLPIEEW